MRPTPLSSRCTLSLKGHMQSALEGHWHKNCFRIDSEFFALDWVYSVKRTDSAQKFVDRASRVGSLCVFWVCAVKLGDLVNFLRKLISPCRKSYTKTHFSIFCSICCFDILVQRFPKVQIGPRKKYSWKNQKRYQKTHNFMLSTKPSKKLQKRSPRKSLHKKLKQCMSKSQ